MGNMIRVSDELYFLPSTEAPFSADIYLIKGEKKNYLFDIGIGKEARKIVDEIDNKVVIISHFHQDHLGNLKFYDLKNEDIFIGDYTYKIIGYGTVVRNIIEINDKVNLKIIPIPNSHAKGSLVLLINNEILLMGDSLYCNTKGYNVSLLNSEIKLLKELDFKYAMSSHKDKLYPKKIVLDELEYYYSKRSKDKPYISFKEFDYDI